MNDKNTLLDILRHLKINYGNDNQNKRNQKIVSIYRYLFNENEDLIEIQNNKYEKNSLGIYISNLDIVINNHLELININNIQYKKTNNETAYLVGQCNDTERKIKQLGIGVLFSVTDAINDKHKEKFKSVLMEFNCPHKVAENIWSDLKKSSKRHTTTQYHISEKIDSINKKLSKINIEIKRVLPKIKTESKNINKKELIDSIKQLEKQYKNFKP